MTISEQIQALQTDKTNIANAITAKGGTVQTGDGFDDFATDIATIPTGGGAFIVITSFVGATLTCGSQTYTLTGEETSHAFPVQIGTYTCSASKTGYETVSTSVVVSENTAYSTSLYPTRLPAIYQEVEYLASSRQDLCYIDSLIIPVSNTKIEIRSKIIASTAPVAFSSSWHSIYGASTNYALTINHTQQQVSYQYRTYNDQSELVDLNTHTYIQEGNKFYKDGVLTYTSPNSWSANSNHLFIFARSTTNGGSYSSCYICKIWADGTELSFEGIPCYRKSDSKPGMYDLVTNTFFTNANTSASTDFTVGPDV